MPDPQTLPASLSDWLTTLEHLHPKSIALGLERVGLVRDRLALHPAFPVITVAGTNGKGSTCAMLERIYLEAGYRVACYTSPHLLRYNERVRVDGVEASDEALCTAFSHIEPARQDTPLTYFEYGTLAAMWLFMRANVDVAILEVGLGGRLDAVNLFDPACAILTSVDLDHMDYLGNNREEIGREKAGVFRAGVPALCGDPQPPATVEACARALGADFWQIGRAFGFRVQPDGWAFERAGTTIAHLPRPALRGDFQLYNAACVVAAVEAMQTRLPVAHNALRHGLQQVRLAGRFQTVSQHPQIILDVAHNPHAAAGLAENLRRMPVAGRTLAVFAMLSDKDIDGVVRMLAEEVSAWYLASIHLPRGATAAMLEARLGAIGTETPIHCCEDVAEAFRQACLEAGENDRIVAFGSFYTVADVMRQWPQIVG